MDANYRDLRVVREENTAEEDYEEHVSPFAGYSPSGGFQEQGLAREEEDMVASIFIKQDSVSISLSSAPRGMNELVPKPGKDGHHRAVGSEWYALNTSASAADLRPSNLSSRTPDRFQTTRESMPPSVTPYGEACFSWDHLPDGVMSGILQHLPMSAIRVMRTTCKGWNISVGKSISHLRPDTLRNGAFFERFPAILDLDVSQADCYMDPSPKGDIEIKPGVTDSDMSTVSNFLHLTSLCVQGCERLTGSGLHALRSLLFLRSIDLTGCKGLAESVFVREIQTLKHIESITLIECVSLGDSTVATIAQTLPRIRRLAVPPNTTDRGLHFIQTSRTIERVAIRSCHEVTPWGIRTLLKTSSLRRVVVCKCKQVSAATLSKITNNLSVLKYEHNEPELKNSFGSRRRSLDMELMLNSFCN